MQIDPHTVARATVERLRDDVPGFTYEVHANQNEISTVVHVTSAEATQPNPRFVITSAESAAARAEAAKMRAVIHFQPAGTRVIAFQDLAYCEYANPNWYDWLVGEIRKV